MLQNSRLAFHHIGVASRNFEVEERCFAALGYVREGADFHDPIQGVHGRFLIGGGPRLELLRNDKEPGVLSGWLKKGVRFYHLAYEADDLERELAEFLGAGARQVVAPVPAVAFNGRLITFIMLQNLSLVELISTR
ncbi:MAG: VOC family protein [Candidatus Velthaea sp.]